MSVTFVEGDSEISHSRLREAESLLTEMFIPDSSGSGLCLGRKQGNSGSLALPLDTTCSKRAITNKGAGLVIKQTCVAHCMFQFYDFGRRHWTDGTSRTHCLKTEQLE